MKNVELLNIIRANMSQQYQDRIPEATQLNLAEVSNAILEDTLTRNEFLYALTDQIARIKIRQNTYVNPLAFLKQEKIDYGNTIEEVYMELIKAQGYDIRDAEDTLFKRQLPNVSAIFHKINRRDRYDLTYEEEKLSKAFLSEDGISQMLGLMISRLSTSDNVDEFLIMKSLFGKAIAEGLYYNVTVVNPTDSASASNVVTKIKTYSNFLKFPRQDYNSAGVTNWTEKSRQILYLEPVFDALSDVEVLAKAFNLSLVDYEQRKVLVDDFGTSATDIVAILASEDWQVCADNVLRTETVFNGKGLYMNYFLHHWGTYSSSRFEPFIVFRSVVPTLVSIEIVGDSTAQSGSVIQFDIVPTGTNLPPKTVEWEISGQTDDLTYINSVGMLVVGSREEAGTITVTATSKYDATKVDTQLVTVS